MGAGTFIDSLPAPSFFMTTSCGLEPRVNEGKVECSEIQLEELGFRSEHPETPPLEDPKAECGATPPRTVCLRTYGLHVRSTQRQPASAGYFGLPFGRSVQGG